MEKRSCALLNKYSAFFVIACFTFLVVLFAQKVAANDEATAPYTFGSKESLKKSALVELHEDNWQLMLKGEWMVEFFAPWCPACKNLASTWERFASAALGIHINVAKIDVTTSPSLSGRFFVTALPTIYHVKDGEFRQYRGSRDGDSLMLFVKQNQWQKLDPISAWKKPDTIHMSILSYFFKLSHTLKDFNTRLQEEYGLPTWGSYALFAIGTIFVGAALGLLLVCIVDFLYPPKKAQRQSFSESKDKSYNGVEDIANDEIEDDAVEELDRDAEGNEINDKDDNGNDDENIAVHEEYENDSSSDNVNSKTESDEPESNNYFSAKNNSENKTSHEKLSPSEVRKRKPRKAD